MSVYLPECFLNVLVTSADLPVMMLNTFDQVQFITEK